MSGKVKKGILLGRGNRGNKTMPRKGKKGGEIYFF